MINHGHVHNGHAYDTLTHPFFKILKKIYFSSKGKPHNHDDQANRIIMKTFKTERVEIGLTTALALYKNIEIIPNDEVT